MRSLKSLTFASVVVACLAASRSARADETEGPSPVLLGAGIAVAVGGGALMYTGAREFSHATGVSSSGLALTALGSLTLELGGALETAWAWKSGESTFASDLRANAPLVSRRPLAVGGLVVGAAALVGTYVGSFILLGKDFSCVSKAGSNDAAAFQDCIRSSVLTSTIVELAAGGVLLVAAPVAGYGFGYDSAARLAGHPFVSIRATLAPQPVPGGGGLALVGRFY